MHTLSFAQAPFSVAQLASLQGVYLSRLERLVKLRSQHKQELNGPGILLLDRSIFSAYYACRNNGVRSEAGRILEDSQTSAENEADSGQPLDGVARRSSMEPQNMTAPSPHAPSMDARSNDSASEAAT